MNKAVVAAWLQAHCRPDLAHPVNTVSSIYYDTLDWRHLREKVNGDFIKSKLRVRWYSGDPTKAAAKFQSVFAELKSKVGAKRGKQRVKVDLDGDWLEHTPLNVAALLNLPSVLLSRGFTVPARLFPMMLISYRRRRFIDLRTDTRINLDDHIRVQRVNPQVIQTGQPVAIATPVIEFKRGDNQMPRGFEPLLRFGVRRASFSKYMMCYRSIRGALIV